MTNLTPSGFIGIDEVITAYCERIYRQLPESDVVQALQANGWSASSADRHEEAIKTLKRAVDRGTLGVFVWHSGMSAAVKLSPATLKQLRMLGRRTFLRTGHNRPTELFHAGILGELAKSFSAPGCFLEEPAFRIWLERTERRRRSARDGDIARPTSVGRPPKIGLIQPFIIELVERGRWDRSQSLKRLVDLVNRRLPSGHLSWDTAATAVDDLFGETRDGRYDRRRKKNKSLNLMTNPSGTT